MLEHGGKARLAARKYGIALEDILDLSTGISPINYSIPEIPSEQWRRLPEDEDGLEEVASQYYGTKAALAVSGSQSAIQALPRLRPPSRVALLSLAYNEHAYAWKNAGHEVLVLSEKSLIQERPDVDVLVLCNPNNPTGFLARPEVLLAWLHQLVAKGGWLVVDEAFMDCSLELSMASHAGIPGLVILRSVGKFFGLAGARVGFILAWQELLDRLREHLGPWEVAGPSRYVVAKALQDAAWQKEQIARLKSKSARLATLLKSYGLESGGSTHYFVWVPHPKAKEIFECLCENEVLVRFFDRIPSLRFGLPALESDWQKLEVALAAVRHRLLTPSVLQVFPFAEQIR